MSQKTQHISEDDKAAMEALRREVGAGEGLWMRDLQQQKKQKPPAQKVQSHQKSDSQGKPSRLQKYGPTGQARRFYPDNCTPVPYTSM